MQLKVNDISFRYHERAPWILKNVSFSINSEERVGIIGPSGCGKSTLAYIIAGYRQPASGQILLEQQPIPKKGYCPVQMIDQHPELAVNPRWKMGKILKEAWNPDKELLKCMGIEKSWMARWPSELSGGELQRFCIARVLSLETKFLICDEITAMMDVITQAQIWQLLLERSEQTHMGILVITHNRALADKVCTRIIELPKVNTLQ